MVLIPKGGGDYRGIGLVEVIWKAVAAILNFRFTVGITYHDLFYGFQVGWGTGTDTLEINLLRKDAASREAILYVILLDLHKAYDALDRFRCLGILEGYGVEHRKLLLLLQYWARLRMLERAGGYYGAPFHGKRGVTQGNPLYPTILNVVVDAVVCHWESVLVAEREEQEGGYSSGDIGDRTQMAGRTIRDLYDRRK